MTTTALAYGKMPKRRRSLSPMQRRMIERGLGCCPSCVAARPERAALLAARASKVRADVTVATDAATDAATGEATGEATGGAPC